MSGTPEHIEDQRARGAPFYCGTAFCGHATIEGAVKCWQAKSEAINAVSVEFNRLLKEGKRDEAFTVLAAGNIKNYPELNPANWPINRSSSEMQAEYLRRAKKETKNE